MVTGATPSPETRYARTRDGLYVAYQAVGQGPPDILLLPFMGCIDVMWEEPGFAHLLRRLAGIGRLITLDYRGSGASDSFEVTDLAGPEGYEPYIDDLGVVLDEVGADAVHLIAHGTGGGMGMLFAATYPGRTASLVLVDAWASGTRREDYPWGATPDELAAFGQFLEERWGTGENVVFQAPSRQHDQEFRCWLGRYERAGLGPATAVRNWRAMMAADFRTVLPSIQAPTLVVHKASAIVPLDQGRHLAAHIPGARLVVLPGSDNMFFTETVDDFVDHVEEFVTGVVPVRDPHRALATVLFTDIVASTEHAVRLGDRAWTALLERHDRIVDRELSRHRGRRVNPTGDGVLATFDGPARGVRCARAIIEALRPLGLDVRAGLHCGEVELRGDDIGGMAVHIAARVAAQAEPGQVLVSRTVVDLTAGSGIVTQERGEYGLKGVPGKCS